MITSTQTIVVSHDDSYADLYRQALKPEEGWIITEDTIATTYSKTIWYKYGEEIEK